MSLRTATTKMGDCEQIPKLNRTGGTLGREQLHIHFGRDFTCGHSPSTSSEWLGSG